MKKRRFHASDTKASLNFCLGPGNHFSQTAKTDTAGASYPTPVACFSPESPGFDARKFRSYLCRRTNRDELERLCVEYPYQQFPLVVDGQPVGVIDRNQILANQSSDIPIEPAETIPAHATIRETVAKMIENSMSLLFVSQTGEKAPIGIVTLYDVLRLQHQLSDSASL